MITSILVGLDESPYSEAAVDLGIAWAKQYDCLLIGIGVIDEPSIRGPEPDERLAPSYRAVYKNLVSEASHRVDRILERFTLRCSEAGVSNKLLEDVGSPCEQIMMEAQRYDLIVVGQKSFFNFETSLHECDTVDQLLHATPRSVVVVPQDYQQGSGVLVAYDGSLQSARALHALVASGLTTLGDIHVFCAHKTSAVEARRIADRAVEYLRFHKVAAKPHTVVSDGAASDDTLAATERLGVELVAMGSYGCSMLAEFLLVSVTRTLLEKTKAPLFLYH